MEWVLIGGKLTKKLTAYERFALYLIHVGKTKKQVAKHLDMSVPTLKKFLERMKIDN